MIAEHYRLVERIGSGGTGVVWRAVDERLQRSVAVKQIHIKASLPEGERDVVRQRAIREARNAARFQHPNAIVVFDITEHDGDPCLVMEYLKSRSLAMVLSAQGTLPLTQVGRIGEQVASALIAAHQAGIVHRDVKPGNVLLDDHGTVKITDFGISRATGDVTLTETGLICGTAAYLAPECARGTDPSPASDVFSLGATLFHALEGEPPYGANANPLAVLYAAANGQITEPRNAGPATDFLLQLLSPEPTERPTMRAARDYLTALAEAGPTPVAAGFVPASEAYATRRLPEGVKRSPRPPAAPNNGQTEPISRPLPEPPRYNGAVSPAHPPTAAHPRTTVQPAAPKGSKRKAVLIGSVVGAVVAAGAITVASMNSGGGSGPSAQANAPASSSAGPSSAAPKVAPGQTKNSSQVNTGSAANVIVQFYKDILNSRFSNAWGQLTPAAQQLYGNQSSFQQYWSDHGIQDFGGGISGSNSGDGSADMHMPNLVYTDGKARSSLQYRVIDSSGQLLIDSDTR
ncbi:serine/threonine protein kinase [Nocardia panacis]|uniref:non-specific serine/threonine protein kinase n=1 Tax=Nocardia panacis TaxID=2340916 RepID=A0A3A4JL58_9NOCA|nr:serine/threonine-protein kinase [Nocardia panacis]RJO69345.1 serine/threonine protein kinase [Nocardia panacis]